MELHDLFEYILELHLLMDIYQLNVEEYISKLRNFINQSLILIS
jgi:hypothetical protein